MFIQSMHSVGGLFIQALHEEATPKPSFSKAVSLRQQLDAIALNFEASYIHLKRRLMLVVVIFPEQNKPNFEKRKKGRTQPLKDRVQSLYAHSYSQGSDEFMALLLAI